MITTIQSGTVAAIRSVSPPASVFLRQYIRRTFIDAAGVERLAGAMDSPNYYAQVQCSIASNGTITYPSFQSVSTVDADVVPPKGTGISFVLYDAAGNRLRILGKYWRIPDVETQTLSSIGIYNQTGAPNRDNSAYTKEETNALLDEIQLDSGGEGDMVGNIYDPQNINANVFDRSNHSGQQSASSIADFGFATRALALTGLGAGSAELIAPTDSFLTAFAKANYQLARIEKEYLICKPDAGLDITAKLLAQIQSINESGAKGGEIVIPGGADYTGDGGWDVPSTTTIKGVGKNAVTGFGTRITRNANLSTTGAPNTNQMMFNIGRFNGVNAIRRDVSIKNLEIALGNTSAHGILVSNEEGTINGGGIVVYRTKIKNVMIGYAPGATGTCFKVHSLSGRFESILNVIEECDFIGGAKHFYCNTNNSGFAFKNIYSSLTDDGIAADVDFVGNLVIDDWLSIRNSTSANTAIFLRTLGEYNNIVIKNSHNENVAFIYKNQGNHFGRKAITWENNLLQGKMVFNAQASLIDDNNTWVNTPGNPNIVDSNTSLNSGGTGINGGWVHLYRPTKGYTQMRVNEVPQGNPVLTGFTNKYSRIIDPAGNINPPVYLTTIPSGGAINEINASRGAVIVPAGANPSVQVFNNLVDANSLVIPSLRGVSGDLTFQGIVYGEEFFTMYFRGTSTANVSCGFEVVKGKRSEFYSDMD